MSQSSTFNSEEEYFSSLGVNNFPIRIVGMKSVIKLYTKLKIALFSLINKLLKIPIIGLV